MPPTVFEASKRVTSTPAVWSLYAAVMPAGPAPITATFFGELAILNAPSVKIQNKLRFCQALFQDR